MVELFSELFWWEQLAYILLGFTLIYQIFVWLGFSIIATHRHHMPPNKKGVNPSISIIVILNDGHEWYVDSELEKILTQKYDGDWEVVAVNDCGGTSIDEILIEKKFKYPHLRSTELKKDPKFPHSRKLPLFLGIKAAKYDSIMIVDPTASPRSDRWLRDISKGFHGGTAIVGYTGFEKGTNQFIRSSRLMSSIRYLSAAIGSKPYRGIYNNIGYSKNAFFAIRAFNHLRLATGEDDLFIQKLAQKRDLSVIVSPRTTMEQAAYGGLGWWWAEQRYRTFSFRYYPKGVRFRIAMELTTKALFYLSAAFMVVNTLALGGWMWCWTVGVGALMLRWLVMVWALSRITKRLGEKKIILPFLVYDILNPITESLLAISRKIKTPSEIWK